MIPTLIAAVLIIAYMEVRMTKALNDLKAAVERNTSVTHSAITLLQGVAANMQAAKDDPEAIEALAAQIDADANALANAITANTNTPRESGPGEPTPNGGPGSDAPSTD